MKPPSRAQLRMLHVLTTGKLVFRQAPHDFQLWVEGDPRRDIGIRFHTTTARIVVERGWAELRKFNAYRGEYGITIAGLALTNDLCECPERTEKGKRGRGEEAKGRRRSYWARIVPWNSEESTELLTNRFICKHCARLVPCVSKYSPLHAADQWHPKWGPVCNEHAKLVTRKASKIANRALWVVDTEKRRA